ncbi:MAG: hypothetical protein LBR56_00990 [Sporomusaceae bacterium]|jgi:hypothetical protein|nr:hypothetical protein [Sporomusaceae bacterium]
MNKVNFNPFSEIISEDFARQSAYIETAFKMLIYDFLNENIAVTGLEVSAQIIADMSVYVKPGRIYEHGKQGQLMNNLNPPLAVTAAHPNYERIDRVCACWREVADTPETRNVMIDTVSRQITQNTVMTRIAGTIDFMIVNGLASPTPAAPTVPDGWISLAQVKVRANTIAILESDILDERLKIVSLINLVGQIKNDYISRNEFERLKIYMTHRPIDGGDFLDKYETVDDPSFIDNPNITLDGGEF